MKRKIAFIALVTAAAILPLPAGAGSIYSSIEEKGEDYGDIYSTRGNRDIYTTGDDRNGLYTSKDNGAIYSSEDKREGAFTTKETPPDRSGVDDVQGADLHDGGGMVGSAYNGYMPGD